MYSVIQHLNLKTLNLFLGVLLTGIWCPGLALVQNWWKKYFDRPSPDVCFLPEEIELCPYVDFCITHQVTQLVLKKPELGPYLLLHTESWSPCVIVTMAQGPTGSYRALIPDGDDDAMNPGKIVCIFETGTRRPYPHPCPLVRVCDSCITGGLFLSSVESIDYQ